MDPVTTLDNNKLSVEDMVDELSKTDINDDEKLNLGKDDEKEEKEEKLELDEEDKDEEEDKEEKKDEEEEEDKPETKIATPVSRKEILKKYPTIFKDFPGLERAYYREREFSEILSTPEDAKRAVERSQQLEELEDKISEGKIESVLTAIKAADGESFAKVVDNYLPVKDP